MANKPRNLKQAQNCRYAVNRLKRFTFDEIANVHLQHVILGYPNFIATAPEVRIIGIDEVLLEDTNKLIKRMKSLKQRVEFQYDTTFKITSYYMSVLVFAHPFLNKTKTMRSPSIPLEEFFHERKDEMSHDEFWRFVKQV